MFGGEILILVAAARVRESVDRKAGKRCELGCWVDSLNGRQTVLGGQ